MKKYCVFFLLFLFPYFVFSQGVGIFSVGTTLESSNKVGYHKSMLIFELDMFGIAPSNGFTFFWNNSVSLAKKDLQFISSEILFGATFRRDKALNISFGLGPRMASSVNFGGLDNPVHIISTLSGLGGTFGLSYYFNDAFGISLFASDFLCLDTGTTHKSRRIHNGGEVIATNSSYKISNTFSIRAGINFRIGGSLYSGYGRRMMCHEGVDAVYECIEVLENTLPMGTLSMNENLCASSLWLAKDQAYHGTTGHDGSDGSTLTDRIKRAGFVGMGRGENCSYGDYTARDFIMGLLIDDNVPSRGIELTY